MSAMLAIVQHRRVLVMADAAIYDPATGILSALTHKIVPIPHTNAVFASRGAAGCFNHFFRACLDVTASAGFGTFDAFRRASDEVWAVFEAGLPAGMGGEIIVAGWSEQYDAGQVLYRSTRQIHEGLPVGNWFLLGDRSAFGVSLDDVPPADHFDPMVHGIPAFEASRRLEVDLACGEGEAFMGHAVGGWVSSVIVEPGFVSAGKIIHRWPDIVGERIDPERALTSWGPASCGLACGSAVS
ncbi:hypothetical protein [Ancylobacter sp. SL191]|uniref:hypothetical protein n=1 Tax=Ancylobacter sp. SL191 TaxID=2995166 RepID=UPI002270ADBB|nr:hypothetical protein [Ancylobacter sp. SL191]WAC25751.1 hypothetical protein OU996_11985 [Ancylobacter sp. SL191]